MNRAKKQEILHRLHSLAEAKKETTKKSIVPRTPVDRDEQHSSHTLDNYQSDIDHLSNKIEWLKGVHSDMLKKHEHAKQRHAAGDHMWVIQNHYLLNKPY